MVYSFLIPYFYGFLTTLALWFVACLISLLLGIFLGSVSSKNFRVSGVSTFVDWFIVVFQGVPFFVQMYIGYFALPDLTGIAFSPFWTGSISLGICSSAYTAEIVRSGLESMPKGQWEACRSLGYNKKQALIEILLPQALVNLLPAISNEMSAILKTTSVISAIGVTELTRISFSNIYRDLNPIPVYAGIAVVYITAGWLIIRAADWTSKALKSKGRFTC